MVSEDTLYEVVEKLVGPINPVGETQADEFRLANLKIMTGLVDKLLYDIARVGSNNADRHECSMKRAGEYANKFMNEVREAG